MLSTTVPTLLYVAIPMVDSSVFLAIFRYGLTLVARENIAGENGIIVECLATLLMEQAVPAYL